jgi:tetratricopeptide (TPR) repeat protein
MIAPQPQHMSDPLRHDGSRAHADVVSAEDRDAKIEQLLLVGLDHYFAARYELAINVWTRALFLDRSHARARAYIDRARSALAERQRESEELLQNGVAAFQRGDGEEARRLLQAAIDGGAPSEEALAVLDRLNRLEPTLSPASPSPSDRVPRERAQHVSRAVRGSVGGLGMSAILLLAATAIGLATAVAWNLVDWQSIGVFTKVAERSESARSVASPVPADAALPLPRRGETALLRARALAAGGHLRDALSTLDAVRSTDPQLAEANRLRAEIQQQLLALTPVPSGDGSDQEKGEPRSR